MKNLDEYSDQIVDCFVVGIAVILMIALCTTQCSAQMYYKSAGCGQGIPCDDGDVCTINDIIQNDCTCAGEEEMDFFFTIAPVDPCLNSQIFSINRDGAQIQANLSNPQPSYTYSWRVSSSCNFQITSGQGSSVVSVTGTSCSNGTAASVYLKITNINSCETIERRTTVTLYSQFSCD